MPRFTGWDLFLRSLWVVLGVAVALASLLFAVRGCGRLICEDGCISPAKECMADDRDDCGRQFDRCLEACR